MVRKAEQMPKLESLGGYPIIGDLEKDFSYAYDEIDAVIFAAGSGGHTGADKTIAVDQFGAIKAIETAKEYGVKRFVLISSLFAGEPEKGPKSLETYLEAKGRADDALINSGLEYTILRPTTLSDDDLPGKFLMLPLLASRALPVLMLLLLLLLFYQKKRPIKESIHLLMAIFRLKIISSSA